MGGTATYSLTVTDSDPLAATGVIVTDVLPAGAVLESSSAGCTLTGSTVSCAVGSLAAGGHDTVTLNVKWTVSGAMYDSASVHSDQINSAAGAQQTLSFGTSPASVSDGPIPPSAYVLLSLMLWYIGRRQLGPAGMRARLQARPRKPPAHTDATKGMDSFSRLISRERDTAAPATPIT